MKIPCPTHGAHFGDEPADLAQCDWYWKTFKLENLPLQAKLDMAQWIMQMPSDKIWLETGWGINVYPTGQFIGNIGLKDSIPDYEGWTDEQRREYQRDFYKRSLKPKGFKAWLNRFKR